MSKKVAWSVRNVGFDARRPDRKPAHDEKLPVGDSLDALIEEHLHEGEMVAARTEPHRPEREQANASGEAIDRSPAYRIYHLAPELSDRGSHEALRESGSDLPPAAENLVVTGEAVAAAPPGQFEAKPAADADRGSEASTQGEPDDPVQGAEPAAHPGHNTKVENELKQQVIREAVATIARRQAMLESEMPPREALVRAAEPKSDEWSRPELFEKTILGVGGAGSARFGRIRRSVPSPAEDARRATMANIGQAVSALEARLAGAALDNWDFMKQPGRGAEASTRDAGARSQPEGTQHESPTQADRTGAEDAALSFEAPPQGPGMRSGFPEAGGSEPRAQAHSLNAKPSLGQVGAALPRAALDHPRSPSDLLATTANLPSIGAPAVQNLDLRARLRPPPALAMSDQSETEQMWGEIRTLLERFRPGSTIETLDRRMQDLAAKVEQRLQDSDPSALIEELSRRIDALQASLRLPASESGSLEELLRSMGDRIDKVRAMSGDMQHLEEMMEHLASKIDDTRSQPDVRAMTALEAQIRQLGERLERSESSLSSLDAVELSLRELFSQLEQTRHATIDAAENAARTAARDTLRAAMHSPALTRSSELRPELADRAEDIGHPRMQQEDSDRRNEATLAGLHEAMNKLVGRLAQLDEMDASAKGEKGAAELPADASAARSWLADDIASTRAMLDDLAHLNRHQDKPRGAEPVSGTDPADSLIEPGTGWGLLGNKDLRPDPSQPMTGRLRPPAVAAPVPSAEGPASFIAAARRAAQAAQASAAATQRTGQFGVDSEQGARNAGSGISALLGRTRSLLARRRRPVLLGVAGLVLLLGALEVVKVELDGSLSPGRRADLPGSYPKTAGETAANAVQGNPSSGSAEDAGRAPSPVETRTVPEVTRASPGASPSKAADLPGATSDSGSSAGATKPGTVPGNGNPFLAGLAAPDGLGEGLRAAALAGAPAAQYEVGLRYAEGRTVNRDPKTAAGWFEKAAAQGLAPAQYRLGSAYEKGVGEAKDPVQAMSWYGRAAEAGNIRAMHNLAVMAAEGAGAKPDYVKAATWFGKAASFGVRDSQFNLAILYARGLGIEQNLGQSYTWFAIAGAQGDEDAAKKRDEVGARLDPKALAAAKAAAESFKPLAVLRSANEVVPPAGGWDALAPTRPATSSQKGGAAKIPVT